MSSDLFKGPIGRLLDGTEVIAFPTAYGDGVYADNLGNRCPVDAGVIGLVPVARAKVKREGLMVKVRFDAPVRCTSEGGRLTFGPCEIDTTVWPEE